MARYYLFVNLEIHWCVIAMFFFSQLNLPHTERIERFIDAQALSRFGSTPALPPSSISKQDQRHKGRLRKRDVCWREKGKGRAWSRIIRPQESLVLYKSFNPLWSHRRNSYRKRGHRDVVFVLLISRGGEYCMYARTTTRLSCVHFINCTPTFSHTQLHSFPVQHLYPPSRPASNRSTNRAR
jgi:hypothetical protein